MRFLTGVLVSFVLVVTACGDDTADDAIADDTGATTDASDDDVADDPATTDDGATDDANTDPETGDTATAEQQSTCDVVADALEVGPDAMSPSDAAQTLIDDPEPAPPGVLEALEAIVAIEGGQDFALEPIEIIDRLVGYYSFCDEITQIDFGLESDGYPPCASAADFPGFATYEVTGIEANDPDGGLVVREGPGRDFAEIGALTEGTQVSTVDTCSDSADGGVWWLIDTFELFGWVNNSFLRPIGDSGAADAPDARDATDAATEELGISCFYKFDEAACGQWGFDDPDQGQAPTDILELECGESASRRTLACAELGVRGFEIDAAHGALNLEIIQSAGGRCEEGIESFTNPNLHSLACDYGQTSGT